MLLNTLNDVDNNYGRSHFTGAKVTIDFRVPCTLLNFLRWIKEGDGKSEGDKFFSLSPVYNGLNR